jgi:hypothetical protein
MEGDWDTFDSGMGIGLGMVKSHENHIKSQPFHNRTLQDFFTENLID